MTDLQLVWENRCRYKAVIESRQCLGKLLIQCIYNKVNIQVMVKVNYLITTKISLTQRNGSTCCIFNPKHAFFSPLIL